jgi:hypothetical protein
LDGAVTWHSLPKTRMYLYGMMWEIVKLDNIQFFEDDTLLHSCDVDIFGRTVTWRILQTPGM